MLKLIESLINIILDKDQKDANSYYKFWILENDINNE